MSLVSGNFNISIFVKTDHPQSNMKAPYDDLNFVRELSKYKWCRANLAVIKRFLLPDWSVYGKISVKSRKIGKRNTLKRNTQKKKKKGYETEKNLNMESDQPEIKVIAPLHEKEFLSLDEQDRNYLLGCVMSCPGVPPPGSPGRPWQTPKREQNRWHQ